MGDEVPEPADEQLDGDDLQGKIADETGWPLHRWVFRALVLGVVGGLFSAATMFLGAVMRRGGIPGRLSYGLLLSAGRSRAGSCSRPGPLRDAGSAFHA